MIDRLRENPEWAKTRDIVVAESPVSSNSLVKDTIFIKMVDGATRNDRSKLTNSLLAVIEDTNLFLFDTISFAEDMQKTMKLVEFFNFITSMICFILGGFQLIMTIAANINDSMWELGVLRSMGCTRAMITRIMVYELISNTLSAMTIGYSSGILVSILAIAQFHVTVELPLQVNLPQGMLMAVGICAIGSLVLGAKYGTTTLYKKNIASILKG